MNDDQTTWGDPRQWARMQVEKILETGTTEGIDANGLPIVLLTLRGAKSGRVRHTPVMRVEHYGRYAVVASKSGAASHPDWYHNIKAHPEIKLQDGTETRTFIAREVQGSERAEWWQRAVDTFPQYASYQAHTDRAIPVLVLERK
ncbi:nitroreductase family deazaflavin-dependent oxidoreductase [Actinacidiphila glaucinigra]|uniref:nitroreductase family deazaflavin-dependent oxidoreductase n=1 Tax=Actinacidiphila glaucinigra TaxID=235986 RepID=UPI0036856F9A